MKHIYKLSGVLLIVVSLVFIQSLNAQVTRSAYFMDHLPVANTLNPTFQPPNNFFIDLPVISSTYFSFDGPINYSEMTQRGLSDDKLYINKTGIIDAMDEVGLMSFELHTELIKTGFRAGKHYFTFNIAKVLSNDLFLERDLMEFMLFGNGSENFLGKNMNFSETGIKASLYHEFGLGYALEVSDKFTIGARLKYLNGAINIWSERTSLSIHTDPDNNYSLSASTDLLIHTASSFGYLEDLSFSDPLDYVFIDFSGNHGYAADFGMSYKPMEKIRFSASVLDLGKINWKDNVKSYVSKNPNQAYTFEGFDISDMLNGGSIEDSVAILDSITDHFAIESIHEPYTSFLTPRAYFGISFDLTKHDQLGLLVSGKFPQDYFLTAYTINYRRTFGDVVAAFVNYTFKKNSNTIGAGLSVRAGPVIIYAMNDMVSSLFQPTKARGYNVQFGITMVFGKPYRDQALPVEENPVERKQEAEPMEDNPDEKELKVLLPNGISPYL